MRCDESSNAAKPASATFLAARGTTKSRNSKIMPLCAKLTRRSFGGFAYCATLSLGLQHPAAAPCMTLSLGAAAPCSTSAQL